MQHVVTETALRQPRELVRDAAPIVSVHRAEHEEYGVTAPVVPVRLNTERLIEAATVMGRALLDDPPLPLYPA